VDKIDRFYRHLAGLLTALDELHQMNVLLLLSRNGWISFRLGPVDAHRFGYPAEIYLDNLRSRNDQRQRSSAPEWDYGMECPVGYCKGLCAECEDPNGKGIVQIMVSPVKPMENG